MDSTLEPPIPFILPALEVKDARIASARHAFDKICKAKSFSTRVLAYAMQNGISTSAIKAYLNLFDKLQLKESLKKPVYSKVLGFGVPVLFYAVESRSEENVRMLYDFGADFQARTTDWEIGILAYTILQAQVDRRDTTELFRVLVALGADPAQIQKSLWKDYLNRTPVPCMKALTPRDKAETCIQNAVACAVNVTQRYLLHIAHASGSPHSPSGTEREIGRIFGDTGVLELTYAIVGQPLAKRVLTRYLQAHYLFTKPKPKPIAFAFTGVTGHGKSALAKRLAGLLNCEYHYVDCEGLKTRSELFGPIPTHLGSGAAGSLNKFLCQNEGKRCVVYLDSFEIASETVRNPLPSLLDHGVYTDRDTGRELRPSMETIWILATDLSSRTLSKFAQEHGSEMLGNDFFKSPAFKSLSKSLRKDITEMIGPRISGRLRAIIPFFPFSKQEAAVVAHGHLLQYIHEYREPRNLKEGKPIGDPHLDYLDDGELCKIAAEWYQKGLGASSLEKAVHRVLSQPVTNYDLDGKGVLQSDPEATRSLKRCAISIEEERPNKFCKVEVHDRGRLHLMSAQQKPTELLFTPEEWEDIEVVSRSTVLTIRNK